MEVKNMKQEIYNKAHQLQKEINLYIEMIAKLDNRSSYPLLSIGTNAYTIDEDLRGCIIEFLTKKLNDTKYEFEMLED
jgi:hypothetical protein